MDQGQDGAIPPIKRKRDDSTSPDPRTRSKYWFEDGNIVLQTENTLFRVHQSILSRESEKDTFSKLQVPSPENERIEGCPVFCLSDTAEDMGNIISLLYDSKTSLNIHKDLTVKVLTSMLRLGRKYSFTHIVKRALEALHHDYPTTLREWDSLSRENRRLKHPSGPNLFLTTQVISIGHEFDLFTILPAAYVNYLQLGGLTHTASDNRLPEKARKRCLVGNSRILEYLKGKHVDALCPPLIIPSEECSSRRKCAAQKWQTIKSFPIWSTKDSIGVGLFRSEYPVATENLCWECRDEAIKLTKQVRSDFWSILPSFFELPAWKYLKDAA